MKIGLVAFLLIISHTMAAIPMEFKISRVPMKMDKTPVKRVNTPDVDLCPLCIQFAGQFINQLLNIILNAGVVGGCGELCGILAQETNKVAGEVCEVLCSIVGIEAFIKIIEKADLDPIYYCELLDQCPIFDGGDAKITELIVHPSPVIKGRIFHINMTYVSMNGTGTGELALQVQTADGIPLGDSELREAAQPGTYLVSWEVKAEPDPNCDPTQGPCEQWLPGNYSVSTAVCNGECGSNHPHSQIYDMATKDFNVVEQN